MPTKRKAHKRSRVSPSTRPAHSTRSHYTAHEARTRRERSVWSDRSTHPSYNSKGPNFAPEVLLTRRNLLIGAGAIGGVAALGGIGSALINAISPEKDSVTPLSVPEDAVTTLDNFTNVAFGDYVQLAGSFHLPSGSLVWADNDSVAACLCPTEGSNPINTIQLLYLSTGNRAETITKPQGLDEGFEILDVRASESGLIWVESNIYENTWRVYTARIANGAAEGITKVDEGDANWLIPSVAAVGNAVFWQVIADPNGEASREEAALKASRFGSSEGQVIYTTPRTFATRLVSTGDGVVITPRADAATLYYNLTKISADDFSTVDQLTLPHNMAPSNVGYGRDGFAFSFNSIYNYGGGISKLGTYTPMQSVEPYHYDGLSWFRFARTPSANPTWCSDWFIVKSTRAITGVHFDGQSYFTIDTPTHTDSYGEYLVSSGSCSKIVGLSQIIETVEGDNDYTLIRVYTPTGKSVGTST